MEGREEMGEGNRRTGVWEDMGGGAGGREGNGGGGREGTKWGGAGGRERTESWGGGRE